MLATIACAVSISGCVTILESKQVPSDGSTDSVPGIRYSLPQPFLLVTPKSDGTIDVTIEMLPDASRTYAITQKSFVGSHTLNVEVEHGLLKAIDYGSDASQTAAKLVENYGELKKASIEAEAAQAKTSSDASKAAKQKVVDAEAAQKKAQAVHDYLKEYTAAHPADTEAAKAYLAAQVELQKANADLLSARDAALVLGLDSLNAPIGANAVPSAFGPVLFRIVQTPASKGVLAKDGSPIPDIPASVDLIAVGYGLPTTPPGPVQFQLAFETSMLGLPPPEQPVELALIPKAKLLQRGETRVDVVTTVPVTAFVEADSTFYSVDSEGNATARTPKPTVLPETSRSVAVVLPAGLPPGDYRYTIMFTLDKAKTKKQKTDLGIKIAK